MSGYQRKTGLAIWIAERVGWRPLYEHECAWLEPLFGVEQAMWLRRRMWIGLRRWGDVRRALCMHGAWVSLPKDCFSSGGRDAPLRLEHPAVAAVCAHEILHALQRRQGMAVLWPALYLQVHSWWSGRNPYAYPVHISARHQLRQFWSGTVEQQGQMWQDYVWGLHQGQPPAHLMAVAKAVYSGRLQRKFSGSQRGCWGQVLRKITVAGFAVRNQK